MACKLRIVGDFVLCHHDLPHFGLRTVQTEQAVFCAAVGRRVILGAFLYNRGD